MSVLLRICVTPPFLLEYWKTDYACCTKYVLVISIVNLMEGHSNNDFTGPLRRRSASNSSLSPGRSLQQTFKRGSDLRSVSCDSDDNQDRRRSLSGSDQEDTINRKRSHTSTEDSSPSSAQDSDNHVHKKPHLEGGTGHEYSDFARKMMVNTMDVYSHVFTRPYTCTFCGNVHARTHTHTAHMHAHTHTNVHTQHTCTHTHTTIIH